MHKKKHLAVFFLPLFHTQITFVVKLYTFDSQSQSVCVCLCVYGDLLGRALACLFSSALDLL